jgi:hypothetical protein
MPAGAAGRGGPLASIGGAAPRGRETRARRAARNTDDGARRAASTDPQPVRFRPVCRGRSAFTVGAAGRGAAGIRQRRLGGTAGGAGSFIYLASRRNSSEFFRPVFSMTFLKLSARSCSVSGSSRRTSARRSNTPRGSPPKRPEPSERAAAAGDHPHVPPARLWPAPDPPTPRHQSRLLPRLRL